MTELSWLCDLLVNHKLSPALKKHVAQRITEIESQRSTQILSIPVPKVIHGAVQSPSTVALMEKHEGSSVEPQAIVASTAQTQAALAQRQQAISQAMSGKPEIGQKSPRKW